MVPARRLYKMLLLLFLGYALPAQGQDSEALHFIGRYDFSWDGIALASAELSIDKTRKDYDMHLALVSGGIVNLFTRHRSDTKVSGRCDGDTYYPRLYESHYWTKNKPRHIRLAFDGEGRVIEELNEPPEDRNDRPEVSHDLKDGALDPLSLLLVIPGGDHTLHVFDAKRLYEGDAVRKSQAEVETYSGTQAAVRYDLWRKPIAGLTQKELTQYRQGEPHVAFYYSTDGRNIPLYMSMPLLLGRLQGALAKECDTWDECRVN